ncbi:MAG TPA: hypothetical protein VNG53_05935 [Bacteroidia bacterium]|nr:hypothetical protein [Bacteroidia bacterium]
MVKLGFIAEGTTEKIVLESDDFRNFLTELKIDFILAVINAEGCGNLLPHNIEEYSQILIDKGATKIIILSDLDEDICVTITKERIKALENHLVIISKKQIEAWFLADTEAMKHLLLSTSFEEANPESHPVPFETIKQIRVNHTGRGVGSKIRLATYIINQSGFSVKRAAEHPHCSSAKYFIDKLKAIATS